MCCTKESVLNISWLFQKKRYKSDSDKKKYIAYEIYRRRKKLMSEEWQFYKTATKVEEQMKETGRVDKKDRLTQTVKIMACNAMAFKVYGAGQQFSTFSVYQNHPRRF